MKSKLNEVVLISRLFQEDEEMLILTHSDELNRTYGEDNVTNQNNRSSDYTKRNRTLFGRNSLSPTEQDNPSIPGCTSTLLQESPTFKETRATVISTGPRTITITSAVSAADSVWFKNNKSYGKRRRSSEMRADKIGSNVEKNPSFNQSNKRGSYRLFRGNMQKQRLSEDVENKKEGAETVEGTSPFCASLEEERARMSLANPVQSPRTGTTGLKPTLTITAWEAGWNVTNAIQVHLYSIQYMHGRKSLQNLCLYLNPKSHQCQDNVNHCQTIPSFV